MIWSCRARASWGRAVWNGSRTAAAVIERRFCLPRGDRTGSWSGRAAGAYLVPRTADWHPVNFEAVPGDRAAGDPVCHPEGAGDLRPGADWEAFVSALPAKYRLRQIDEALVAGAAVEAGVEQGSLLPPFEGPADCCRRGLGFVAMYEGAPVGGGRGPTVCTTGASRSRSDTREDHRRRGLASSCGRGSILECLDRGLYPSWDRPRSAKRLPGERSWGTHRGEPYTVYWLNWDGTLPTPGTR